MVLSWLLTQKVSKLVNSIKYVYNPKYGGYIFAIQPGYTHRELYKRFMELLDTTFKGYKVFSSDFGGQYGHHWKYYKRLGNKVIYEFIRSKS